MRFHSFVAAISAGLLLCAAQISFADPIPGRDILKFSQRPMFNTPLIGPTGQPEFFHGHDELSTAWGLPETPGAAPIYQGRFMADDFADLVSSPVVHVKWWGSYLNRPTSIPNPQVQRFLISFEEDVPVGPTNPLPFSHPGEPLLNQIVGLDPGPGPFPAPGRFTEREFWPESVDGPIYEYNAELHLDKSFFEKQDTVYWLKIVALVDIPNPDIPIDQRLQWGWHNRDYTIHDPFASTPPAVIPGEHIDTFLPQPGGDVPVWHFQDDAVSGNVTVVINNPNMPFMPLVQQNGFEPQNYQAPADGPSLIATRSKDLAFELYTIPEPAMFSLAVLAAVGMMPLVRRRR